MSWPGASPSPVLAYWGVIRRRLAVIIGVVVVFTGLTLGYTLRQPPVYQASSRVLLQGTLAEQIIAASDVNSLAVLFGDRGETEIQVMQSPAIVDAVAAELGHEPTVSVGRIGDSVIVEISATAGEGQQAARDATTFAHVYVEVRKQQQLDQLLEATSQFQARITELDNELLAIQAPLTAIDAQIAATTDAGELARLQTQRRIFEQQVSSDVDAIANRRATYVDQVDRLQFAASTTVTGGAQVVADASEPSSPIAPDPLRAGTVAFGLSLLVGVALAFLFEQLDDGIRSTAQLERITAVTTIGLIPSVPRWRKGKEREVIRVDAENSAAAEAYRSLRTAVQFMGIDRPAHVIQITSALPSEGKTTTAANLGIALARAGKRVVVVDSDLRRPRLHELFRMSARPGLTSVLLRELTLSNAVRAIPGEPRLSLLTSGDVPPNPAELLTVGGYAEVISALRAENDYVLLDTPPVLPVADARLIAALVDLTLLVVAANASAEKHITRSLELLQQVDARVAGTILNDIPTSGRHSLSYGYWYSYAARPGPKRSGRSGRNHGFRSTRPKVAVGDVHEITGPDRASPSAHEHRR